MIAGLASGERDGGHSLSHTAALADAVRGYPMGIGLVKEFLQNADDAGATELRVVFDRRRHAGTVAPDASDPSLDVVLEPALLFINDAKFDQDDINGIRRIGQSVKFSRASGTGRFGKGFCTAFSVSDHPTLVTGDDVMWFDPHRRAICSSEHSSKHEYMRRFGLGKAAEILPAWIATFSVAGVEHTGAPFEGTVFRLPLRSSDTADASEISHQCFTDEVWESIVESARELGPALLVFLRSVDSLALSEVNEAGEVRVKLKIATNNAAEVRAARKPLREATEGETVALLKQWLGDPSPLPTAVFGHDFLVTDERGDLHQESWSVVTGLIAGPNNSLLEHAHQICTAADPDKVLPWAGTATCLETTREGARLGGRSCFLPIGDQAHPPPVWIHGWFDLDSNRSHLTMDFGSDGDADNRGRWNRALLEHGVGPYWARLVENLGLRLHDAASSGYDRWASPPGDQDDDDYALSTGFYEAAAELAVMRIRSKAGHGMQHPTPALRWVPRGTPPGLVVGLMEDGWRVFDPRPPERIRQGLISAGVNVQALSTDDLREHFFEEIGHVTRQWALEDAPCALLRSRARLDAVWAFFAAHDGDLTGTPLCLTMDGKLRSFDEGELVYACADEQAEILETLPHRRLHPDCQGALDLDDRDEDLGVSPIDIDDLPEFAEELAARDGDITDDWAAAVLDELVRRSPTELKKEMKTLQRLHLLPTTVGSRTPLGFRQTAALVTTTTKAAPEDLLERLGVPIVRGSARLLESARQALTHNSPMMNALSPRFVAKVLGGHHSKWFDPPSHAERLESLNPQEVAVLLDYLAGISLDDSDTDNGIRRRLRERLPLLTSQGDITRANAGNLYRPVGVVPPPELRGGVTLLEVRGGDWDALAEALGVPQLDDARLLMDQALPFLETTTDDDAKDAVRAWVVREAPRVLAGEEEDQVDGLRRAVRRAPLLPLRDGAVGAATDSYQAADDEEYERLIKVLGPDPRVVVEEAPLGLQASQWRLILGVLSVPRSPRAVDILSSILDASEDWYELAHRGPAAERLRGIYAYLNDETRLENLSRYRMTQATAMRAVEVMLRAKNGSIDETAAMMVAVGWTSEPPTFIEVVRNTPWLPARPRKWSTEDDHFQTRLYNPSQLFRPGQRRLVSAVRPVLPFAEPLTEVRDLLGFAFTGAAEMDETGDPGPVGEQLAALLRVEPSSLDERQAAEFQQTVGAVYTELARLEDPARSLEEWDWPHAGDALAREGVRVLMDGRWRAAETLFFNTLALEPNPWVGSIAGWSSPEIVRQRPLLEAVGVRDQPEIEDWLRLLRELHSRSKGEPLMGKDFDLARRAIIKLAGRLRESSSTSATGPVFVLSDDDRLLEAAESFEIDSPRVQSLGDRVNLPRIRREEDNRHAALWGGARPISQVVRMDNPQGGVVEDYADTESVRLLLDLCSEHAAVWASVVARLRYHYAMWDPSVDGVDLATLTEWQAEALELSERLELTVYHRLQVDLAFSDTDHEVLPIEERYFVDYDAAHVHIVESELDYSLDEALARLGLGKNARGPEAAEAGRTLMRVARSPGVARTILDRQNYRTPPDETEALADIVNQAMEDDVETFGEEPTGEASEEVVVVDEDTDYDGEPATASSQHDGVDEDVTAIEEPSTGAGVPADEAAGTPFTLPVVEDDAGAGELDSDKETQPSRRQTGTQPQRQGSTGRPRGSRSSWRKSPTRSTPGARGTPSSNDATDSTRTSSDITSTSRPRDRMTSYVARADGSTNPRHRERQGWEARAERGNLGEEAVVEHERRKGRCAHQMPKGNTGYDIASSPVEVDGLPDMDHPDARYIEVKSSRHGWDAYGVAISEPQFEMARSDAFGPKWWLYVVECVDTEDQVIHEVPNPLRDSGLQYRFDGGWAAWASRRRNELTAKADSVAAPGLDERVGRKFQQRTRRGKLWTFTVLKIEEDKSSGRLLAKIRLESGQTKAIHNLDGWEPVE